MHGKLAELCAAEPVDNPWNWEEAYHQQMAGQHESVLDLVDAGRLRDQLCAFRPLSEIITDIRMAAYSAGQRRDFLGMCNVIFTGVEFCSRENSLSHLCIHKRLLEIGEIEVSCRHARNRVATRAEFEDEEVLDYCPYLLTSGAVDDANQIFALSEPVDLLKSPSDNAEASLEDRVYELEIWAAAAIHFRSLDEIIRLIRGIRHTVAWDWECENGLPALQTRLIRKVAHSLINAERWDGAFSLLDELPRGNASEVSEVFWVCTHGWKTAALHGDLKIANDWIGLAEEHFTAASKSDSQKIALAEGLLRVRQDMGTARSLTEAIDPVVKFKGAMVEGIIDALMPAFRRHRLMYALGEQCSITELIPDSHDSRGQFLVYVGRSISDIGRLWAMAWNGSKLSGPQFVLECRPLLQFVAQNVGTGIQPLHYQLSEIPLGLSSLLIECAAQHGQDAVAGLAREFERIFIRNEYRNWPVVPIVKLLVAAGVDPDWAGAVLELAEHINREEGDADPGSRVSWRNDLAEVWSLSGFRDRARDLIVEAIRLSAGIGFRKDYQLDAWIKWMRLANNDDPIRSAERIRLVSSAVIALSDFAERRMTTSASEKLLSAAVDWSPAGSISLAHLLAESGAISYADAITAVLAEFLRQDSSAVDLAIPFVTEVLIPIASAGKSGLTRLLVVAVDRQSGISGLGSALKTLKHAIDTVALSTARSEWANGLQEGLKECDLDPNHFDLPEFEMAEDTENSVPDGFGNLRFADRTEIPKSEVAQFLTTAEDLLRSMEQEADDSSYDWTDVVSHLAKSFDADECKEVADKLRRRPRESKLLAFLAERLWELADHSGALDIATVVVEQADWYGLDSRFDMGCRRRALEVIAHIRPDRARELAFDWLINELSIELRDPHGTALNLEWIAPLICESVPVLEIWNVVERYLHTLFPEAARTDCPPLSSADEEDSIPSALSREIATCLGHSVHITAQGAMRACTNLMIDGNGGMQSALADSLDSDPTLHSTILTVFEAVSRHHPVRIEPFRQCISELRRSGEQSARWSAQRIATRLEMDGLPSRAPNEVLHHYRGRVIEPPPTLVGVPRGATFDVLPDSLNQREIIGPLCDEAQMLAKAAGVDVDAVIVRVVQFMRQLVSESSWNADGEKELRRRLDLSSLRLPYSRPRMVVARRALHHVIAELDDGGRLSDEAMSDLEKRLRHHDSQMLLFRPIRRPVEIPKVTPPERRNYNQEWVDAVHTANPAALPHCIGNWKIVAEKTMIKPAGEYAPCEFRLSALLPVSCQLPPSGDMGPSEFFPYLVRETCDSYWNASIQYADVLAVRNESFGGFEAFGEEWLAFNPALAQLLGWKPVDGSMFKWKRENTSMVRSVWWSDGPVQQMMEFWKEGEVAAGWMVLASDEAISELQQRLGQLKSIGSLTRQIMLESKGRYSKSSYFGIGLDW